MNRTRVVLGALAVVPCAIAALSALVTAEVVAEGKLVPSGGAGVRRIRVWDSLEFYISGETAMPTPDLMTTLALVVLATAIGFACLLLVVNGVWSRLTLCFALTAAGAAFLAADELLAIHESVGHNLQFLTKLPGVERPDDVVFAIYALVGVAVLWNFRDVLASVRAVRLLLAAGAALALVAVGFDILGMFTRIEDGVELLAAGCIGGAFVALAAMRVPEALTTSVTAMSRIAADRVDPGYVTESSVGARSVTRA